VIGTAPRNEITNRSLIFLLFNDQGPFSLTQLRYLALQVATMCGLRSDKPDHEELRWCIVVDFDLMIPQVKGTFTAQYCFVASISARGEGEMTERIFYHLTDNRPTGAHGPGTISTEDAETDLVVKNLIGSLLANPPMMALSQTATIEGSILQRMDRVPRSSGRAEAVFKRNKPDTHSNACLFGTCLGTR